MRTKLDLLKDMLSSKHLTNVIGKESRDSLQSIIDAVVEEQYLKGFYEGSKQMGNITGQLLDINKVN